MAGCGKDIVLYADRVVLGGAVQPLRVAPASVRVSGTRITAVTEHQRGRIPLPQEPACEVVDLGDRLLTPAFVNGHTHLAMAAWRGAGSLAAFGGNVVEDLFFELETGLTDADVRAFARVGAYESLLAGVGLVWDHYYCGRATADALCDTGLAGVVSPTLQDLAGPGRSRHDAELEATVSIASDLRYTQAGVFAALGPHAADTVSATLWQRVRTLAETHALPVHAHLAQSVEEYTRVQQREGCTPLGILKRAGLLDSPARLLLIHGLFLTNADLAQLSPTKHFLGCCPYSQLRFGFLADIANWTRAGIPWLVGTDCAPCNDSMNLQKELREVAAFSAHSTTFSSQYRRFQATGTPCDAKQVAQHRSSTFGQLPELRDPKRLLATVWAIAGSIHPQFCCGAVEPGHLANLVIWDPHHPALWPALDPLRALAYNDCTDAIDWMMVAGQLLGTRGRFSQSIRQDGAYREALAEADRRLQQHLRRLGLHPES